MQSKNIDNSSDSINIENLRSELEVFLKEKLGEQEINDYIDEIFEKNTFSNQKKREIFALFDSLGIKYHNAKQDDSSVDFQQFEIGN